MRAAGWALPTLAATAVLGLTSAAVALATPAPGYAAVPACAATRGTAAATAAPMATEPPWPQRLYGLDRLSGLADGAGVVVAVVDSGVNPGHPQLAGAVAPGLDALDTGGDGRLDCVGHGTAVASIVAARPHPGTAFRGVAPAATIMPVRVSERIDGAGSDTARVASTPALAAALRQAVDRGARVVNLSLTTDRDDAALREAVRYARSRDVLLVAAAGNRYDAGNPRPYPAGYDGVIGVGAIQPDGTRAAQSQVGDFVDLVAPGTEVTAAAHNGGHARYTGTSFAAAYVAGTAALIRQYHPRLTEAQVAQRLVATADPVAALDLGAGLVNPYRAVTAVDGPRAAADPTPLDQPGDTAPVRANAEGHLRGVAYRVALAGAGAAAALLLCASAIPRAVRRRWRAS
jgi:membrane-anchored mycosin MYCP